MNGLDGDPRVAALHVVVARLRRELAAHPAELSDRAIAEDELAALAAMLLSGSPDVLRLRRSLLLIVGAIGSVSALAPGVGLVREAVESFGSGWTECTGQGRRQGPGAR